jgi:hypothetical protein
LPLLRDWEWDDEWPSSPAGTYSRLGNRGGLRRLARPATALRRFFLVFPVKARERGEERRGEQKVRGLLRGCCFDYFRGAFSTAGDGFLVLGTRVHDVSQPLSCRVFLPWMRLDEQPWMRLDEQPWYLVATIRYGVGRSWHTELQDVRNGFSDGIHVQLLIKLWYVFFNEIDESYTLL